MALRTHRLFHLVSELDVCTALGEPHWLHVVHAAHAKRALDDVSGQPKILLPIGHQRYPAQMPAGGMSADVQPTRITAKTRGVLVNPGDAAANLIGHHP